MRQSLVLCTLGLMLTLSVGTLFATEGSDDINLSNDSSHDAEPSIATNPTNGNLMVVASVASSSDKSLRTWYSTNGGSPPWTSVLIDSSVDGFSSELCTVRADPSVAIADNGTVFVGYVAPLTDCDPPFGSPWKIMCAKSTNNGATYAGMQVGSAVAADKPFLTVGPKPGGAQGYNVYVTYNVATDIYVAKSEDGAAFSAPLLTSMDGSFTVPAVDRLGNLYVVWLENFATASPTVKVGKSTDGGSNFTVATLPRSNVGNTDPNMAGRLPIPAAPVHGVPATPAIAVDRRFSGAGGHPGRIYVSYVTRATTDAADYDLDVVLQHSDDGLAWSDPVVVHKTDGNSQFHSWISVDQVSGAVAVMYLDARNDLTSPVNGTVETWVSVSEDGGETWYEKKISDHTTDQSCTTGISRNYLEYLGVSLAGGIVRGVWPGNPTGVACDDPGGTGTHLDIMFDTIPVADVIAHQVRSVPSQFSTVSAAIQAALAGDVVQVTGTVGGAFTMASNVPVISVAGAAVLDANGASSLVTFPIRYHGTGLASFRLEDFSGTAISAVLGTSLVPAKIALTNLVITNPRAQALKGIDVANVDTLVVNACTISGGTPTGIASSGGLSTISGTTITSGATGVSAAGGGTVNVSTSTLTGQTSRCVDVAGAIATVDRSTFQGGTGATSLLRISGSKYLSGSLPANRIFGCTLQNGTTGVEATNSYTTVDSCTITNPSSYGLNIAFSDPDEIIHTRVLRNLITSTAGLATKGIYLGCFGSNTYTNNRAEIQQNTIDGWGKGIHCETITWPVGDLKGKVFVSLLRNMVTQYQGVGIDKIRSSDLFRDAVFNYANNNVYSTLSSTPGTFDFTEPPLYCDNHDATVQKYTLRIDSVGGPGNVCPEGIGAKPAECAWGTLPLPVTPPITRTAFTVAENAVIRVLEDVTVPSGKSLTVNRKAVVAFDDLDDSHLGSDTQKNELTVNGTLTVSGAAGQLARFESATTPLGEGKWYGIRTNSASSVSVDYASVKNAVYGMVHTSNLTGHIKFSEFSLNQNEDIAIGSGGPDICPVTVERNTITVGGSSGIVLYSEVDQALVKFNTVVGSGPSLSGVKTSAFTTDEIPTVRDNTISGFSGGIGISIESGCAPTIQLNIISTNNYGIKVTSGAPNIGAQNQVNSISSCGYGVLAQGSSALPKMRYNRITGYDRGVRVELGANADIGISTADMGNNAINLGNQNSFCIENVNSGGVPQCRAQGNYFGGSGPGCPAPSCTSGNVDLSNWLCDDPTGPLGALVDIGPLADAERLTIRGTEMSASGLGASIVFRLDGWADIQGDIFDVTGRLVSDLDPARYGPGEHTIAWNGRGRWGTRVPSGIYFVRIHANENLQATARVLIVR